MESKIKRKIYFIIFTPLFLFIIDHIFLSKFLSKYEYNYISITITTIWIYLLIHLSRKRRQYVDNNHYGKHGVWHSLKKTLSIVIGISAFSFVCYCEFNRIPSLTYTLINGVHHSITLDVDKSHPGGKSACSGGGKMNIEFAKNDPFFAFCLTKQQDLQFPNGHSMATFDVIESQMGIMFYNVHL